VPATVSATERTGLHAEKAGLLRRFLQVYWLRPENAFWMALRSETLARCPIVAPSLDVACGDGLFSFLHGGGVLDPAFDVFQTVREVKPRPSNGDDMFDGCNDGYRPRIVQTPHSTFNTGVDHKAALLQKASKLFFYDRLVEHDCNRRLPFDDDTFETVYCNAAYWIDNIDGFLAELRRITRPDGRIVLQVKLDTMARYTLASFAEQLGTRFLEIIDRGRLACWQSLADRATWERRYARAGLEIEEVSPFITATHAHIWDVGLRPIAPLLIRLANAVDKQTREEVKSEWVDLFMDLALPICSAGFNLIDNDAEPAELQYVLQPC